jgi:hypothetical protein
MVETPRFQGEGSLALAQNLNSSYQQRIPTKNG